MESLGPEFRFGWLLVQVRVEYHLSWTGALDGDQQDRGLVLNAVDFVAQTRNLLLIEPCAEQVYCGVQLS